MCKVLKVSRVSYYKFLNKKPSNRELESVKIEKEIINIYKASKNRYGAVKIHKSLKTLGINISIKRTQRLMKKLEIKSIIIKKYRPTTSKSKIKEQENVLKRDFKATTIIESFHASLKKEEVRLVKYFDYDVARFAIFEYIESWYNRKRIHSSIGYLAPQKCEDLARKIALKVQLFVSKLLT